MAEYLAGPTNAALEIKWEKRNVRGQQGRGEVKPSYLLRP